MLDIIAIVLGYITLISGLALIGIIIGIIIWITYLTYGTYLKELFGWKNPQVRKETFERKK